MAVQIGIVGDYHPSYPTHPATEAALAHAAQALQVQVTATWLPTPALEHPEGREKLGSFDALWCAPGSPYQSMAGALEAIRWARERDWPFIGTWGGFQHTLVEYMRHVMGIQNAEHEETAPGAENRVVSLLACSLAGQVQPVHMTPGTLAHRAYGRDVADEAFRCRYGLNPAYREQIASGALRVSGTDEAGEVRIVELAGHRFFLATLFVPQLSSSPAAPHPLIVAYLAAALAWSRERR